MEPAEAADPLQLPLNRGSAWLVATEAPSAAPGAEHPRGRVVFYNAQSGALTLRPPLSGVREKLRMPEDRRRVQVRRLLLPLLSPLLLPLLLSLLLPLLRPLTDASRARSG